MTEPAVLSWGAWIPAAVTSTAGFLAAILSTVLLRTNEALKDKRTSEREREARTLARRNEILERRNEFQRQTLLELQAWVVKLWKVTSEIRRRRFGVNEEAQTSWITDDLRERTFAASSETTKLKVRLRDVTTRALIDKFQEQHSDITYARDLTIAIQVTDEMAETFNALNDQIGVVLRDLEAIEASEEHLG